MTGIGELSNSDITLLIDALAKAAAREECEAASSRIGGSNPPGSANSMFPGISLVFMPADRNRSWRN